MLRLEVLPAGSGDCLWLEYGTAANPRVVIVDGGVKGTGRVLRDRIDRARGKGRLRVELLVVTHLDNDHIVGVLELLGDETLPVTFGDIWFNGRPQLVRLPPLTAADRLGGGDDEDAAPSGDVPADLLGAGTGRTSGADEDALPPPAADLLGQQEADALSTLLEERQLPCNAMAPWGGRAVMAPTAGELPALALPGGLRLTVLGPTLRRLYDLCSGWLDVLGGVDEPATAAPADLLGRADSWPPVWQEAQGRDPSRANGSSIMLLAEHGGRAVLLPGDGHAPDLARALSRLQAQRRCEGQPLPLAAFKLPHHGSEKNLSRAVIEGVDCSRYVISTDGSVHRHPDHQALLRVLRYSRSSPRLCFNCEAETTTPWRDSRADVLAQGFPSYATSFPRSASRGLVLPLSS